MDSVRDLNGPGFDHARVVEYSIVNPGFSGLGLQIAAVCFQAGGCEWRSQHHVPILTGEYYKFFIVCQDRKNYIILWFTERSRHGKISD